MTDKMKNREAECYPQALDLSPRYVTANNGFFMLVDARKAKTTFFKLKRGAYQHKKF